MKWLTVKFSNGETRSQGIDDSGNVSLVFDQPESVLEIHVDDKIRSYPETEDSGLDSLFFGLWITRGLRRESGRWSRNRRLCGKWFRGRYPGSQRTMSPEPFDVLTPLMSLMSF